MPHFQPDSLPIFADSSLQSALAVVCIMDSTPNACAEEVRQERRRERERQQRAEETAEDREQQLSSVCCRS